MYADFVHHHFVGSCFFCHKMSFLLYVVQFLHKYMLPFLNLYFHILCLCKVMHFLKGTPLLCFRTSASERASARMCVLARAPSPFLILPQYFFLIWIISHLLYVCQANRFFQIQSPWRQHHEEMFTELWQCLAGKHCAVFSVEWMTHKPPGYLFDVIAQAWKSSLWLMSPSISNMLHTSVWHGKTC